MSIDDVNTFLAQYLRTQFDPSAPLPDLWPAGVLGVRPVASAAAIDPLRLADARPFHIDLFFRLDQLITGDCSRCR